MSTPVHPTPFPVAARELLRETLLDAARDLLGSRLRWADVTMADIAAAAGVSRQTLYKEFGSRQEFAQALILRESDRFVAAVEHAVNANLDDPTAALSAAFTLFLGAASSDPLVRAVLSDDGNDELLMLVTTQGEPVLQRATESLAAVMVAGWPNADRDDALLLAECVVRLAISTLMLPERPGGLTPDSITRMLGPFVDEALRSDVPGDG